MHAHQSKDVSSPHLSCGDFQQRPPPLAKEQEAEGGGLEEGRTGKEKMAGLPAPLGGKGCER